MSHPSPTLLATAYLPPVAYLACMAQSEAVVIEQHETFPKQTLRNRALIATANGPLTLSVPISRPNGNHTRTHEARLNYAERWNTQHWRAITAAYNTSPYFLYYQDELEAILATRHETLLELNMALLSYLAKHLHLRCPVSLSNDFTPEGEAQHDMRTLLTAKQASSGWTCPAYPQVFDAKLPFQPNMSGIDLLFNLGPEATAYLEAFPPLWTANTMFHAD